MAIQVPNLRTHDLVLSDGTTTLGLILVKVPTKDENGIPILRPAFQRFPAQSLSQQQFQSYSEAIFPPQYQGVSTQKSWHAGFGKQEYEINRYLQSHGTDSSIRGLTYTSPVPVACTKTTPSYASTATITNGDFEAALSPWVTTGDWTRVNTGTPHGGTWHALFTGPGDSSDRTLYQQVVAADCSLFNTLQITVEVWSKYVTTTPSVARVDLVDNNGTVIATAALSNTTTYVKTTLSHTFTDGWPTLRVNITCNSNSDPTVLFYVDDVVVTLTGSIATAADTGTIVKMKDFNGSSYACSETGLWKRTAANWVRVAGSPDSITDMDTDTTNLYLARGTSKNLWWMDTSEVFYRCTGTGASSQPIKLAWVNSLWYGSDDPSTIWKYNSIQGGTVTTNYTVGQTGYNITALVNHAETPCIIKENYAAYINSSDVIVPIAEELGAMYNANTGKNTISWRGQGARALFIPAGAGASLLVYQDGPTDPYGPDMFAERLADFKGQIVAQAADDQWDYIILDNGALIEIMKGRFETIDGQTDFRWHPYVEDTYGTASYAFITTLTAKRLYYGGGAALPKYINLPTQYGDPLNDTNLSHGNAVTHEGCWLDEGLPNIIKTYESVTLSPLGLSAGHRTIKIEYQLWETQTWVELGGAGNGSFSTSPLQTKSHAASIEGRKIRYKETYYTDDPAVGVGRLQATHRYALKPPRLGLFYAKVKVSDRNLYKNSMNKDTEMIYGTVSAQLHSWADSQPLTLTYPDGLRNASDGSHDGASVEVKFMEGYPKEQLLDMGLDDQVFESPESEFELWFSEMDRTAS